MKWKNIAGPTSTFFITATINGWQPLFLFPRVRDILLDDFLFYKRKYSALFHTFVIMPEHYHILITLPEPTLIRSWIKDIQSHSSHQICIWLQAAVKDDEERLPQIFEVLRSKTEAKSALTIWKEQARAEGVFSTDVFTQKLDYIHANPVRRGLVDNPGDWEWTSWRDYFMDERGILDIDRMSIT